MKINSFEELIPFYPSIVKNILDLPDLINRKTKNNSKYRATMIRVIFTFVFTTHYALCLQKDITP